MNKNKNPLRIVVVLSFFSILVIVFGLFYTKKLNAQNERLGFAAFRDLVRQPNLNDATNGIALAEFENFYRDWHLVTARYRVDRQQQRVTFANDIAWKALTEGSNHFPEGAMFAKAGFEVGEDPLFPSSKMPGSQLRLMLMKRDFKKYPKTDGWGYALLNRFGTRLINGEVKYNVEKYKSVREFETSCHACHQLARERDFVFSRPMFEAALSFKSFEKRPDKLRASFHLPIDAIEVKRMKMVLDDAHAENKNVSLARYHEMPLFEGSLPELRAPMTSLSLDDRVPMLIFDPESHFYALSEPLASTARCSRFSKYTTGSLEKKIPERNLAEVSVKVFLCNGEALAP